MLGNGPQASWHDAAIKLILALGVLMLLAWAVFIAYPVFNV
jgi:hypothetical protein